MTIVGSIIGTGQGFQLFYQKDNQPGEYADAAARDLYFGANPDELLRLDQNQFLIIKLNDNGSGQVAYQQRASGTWVDVTTIIQGETGPAGATGNSYFFESVADRDTFFETSPNEGLLMNGLPVIVNIGNEITSTFIWGGASAPTSYDPELWRLAGSEISSGTLLLGQAGAGISSGSEILNFTAADGGESYVQTIQYDDTGSSEPFFYDLPAIAEVTLTDVSDQVLTDPQTITAPAVANVYIKNYTVIPATSGEMRVRVWLGTDDTGPSIVDTYVTVAPGDIGVETTYEAPNNTLILTGQDTYTEFSGVQLRGGVQTLPPFTGQTLIFLKTNSWIPSTRYYLNKDDSTPTANAIFTSDGTLGQVNPVNTILASTSVSSSFFDIDTKTSSGLSRLAFRDNAASNRFTLTYNQLADTVTIATTTGVNTLLTSGGELEIRSIGDMRIQPLGDYPITLNNDEAYFTIQSFANNYAFLFENGLDNSVPLLSFSKTGTAGGSSNWFFSTVNPEGLTTASGGDICILKSGTSSNIYLKLSDTSNTGWQSLLGDIIGPSSSVDSALALFNSTDGKLQKSSSYVTVNETTRTELKLKSSSATEGAQILLESFSGTRNTYINYDEISLSTTLLCSGAPHDLFIGAQGVIEIESVGNYSLTFKNDNSSYNINNSSLDYLHAFTNNQANTNALIQLTQTGTNGGTFYIFAGSGSPEGITTATGGSFYVDSTNYDWYIKDTATGNTGWKSLLHEESGVQGPATSTITAIPTYDVTDGTSIKDNPLLRYTATASTSSLIIRESTTGSADLFFEGTGGTPIGLIQSLGSTFAIEAISVGGVLSLGGLGGVSIGSLNGSVLLESHFEVTNAGNDLAVIVGVPATNKIASLSFEDSLDAQQILLSYNELTDIASLTSTGNFTLQSTNALTLQGSNASLASDANSTVLSVGNLTAVGQSGFEINNSAGSSRYSITYNQSTGDVFETTTSGASYTGFYDGTLDLSTFSNVAIGSINDNLVDLYNTTSTFRVDTAANGGRIFFTTLSADTEELIFLNKTGTNGGSSQIFLTSRTPLGNIPGNGGDVALRDSGTNSNLYLKRVDGGTTGWNVALTSATESSTLNAAASFDSTTGNSLAPVNTALIYDTGSTTLVDLKPVTVSGNAEVVFRNVANTVKTEVYYYEGADEFAIECNATAFRLVGNSSPITFASSSAEFDLYIRTATPLNALDGDPGDKAIVVSGNASSEYINTGSTTDNRIWSKYILDSDTNAFGGFGRLQNRIRWSEDLTQSTWVDGLGNTTIIPGATTGPNGELVDNVQWDSAGLGLRQGGLGTVQGNTYTVSFFAKHISGTNQVLFVDINDGSLAVLTIDSNEWQRYSAVVTAGGSAGQWIDFTHNGTSTFAIWGVQVNDGADLYPYLKTEDIARKDITDYGLAVDGDIIVSGTISGSITLKRVSFSATTTTEVLGAASLYACTDTAAARTLTISTSTIALGSTTNALQITVKDESGGAGTNNITITPESGTIDGQSSVVITADYGDISMYSDGTNLYTIGA